MKVLFNKNSNGAQEVKELLGWMNTSMKYDNLISDIKLETPRLIEFIGKETYEEIYAQYLIDRDPAPIDPEAEPIPDPIDFSEIITYSQLFILCMAYLSYARNNDLIHSNNGRKQQKADNQSAAWEWQIKADEGATMRRAYKALDRLIANLTELEVRSWLTSDAYKKAQNLLITTTDDFDNIHPIDNSGQMYYRLVPFMEAIETEHVNAYLDAELLTKIKSGAELDASEKLIQLHAKRVVANLALSKAYLTFPLEMFPGDINYAAGANYKHTVTGNKSLWFKQEADHFSRALQAAYAAYLGNEDFTVLPSNANSDKKFVNL